MCLRRRKVREKISTEGLEWLMQRFLNPAVLAGISSLDLLAKTVVDGFVAGLHRSPDFGFRPEVAEYRAYTPGDDLRHVDWNVFCRTERGERRDFAKLMKYFQELVRKRGIVIVISDFYEQPEVIVKAIEPLRFHGNEVVLFHVLDPQEIRPELNGPAILVDMETQQRLEVIPEYTKETYRQKMDGHIEQLRDRSRAVGVGDHLLGTDQPRGRGLRENVTLRQGR